MRMFLKILTLTFLHVVVSIDYSNEPTNYIALRFRDSTQDYAKFTAPDLTRFTTALTVSAWLKRQRPDTDHYGPLFLSYKCLDNCGTSQLLAGPSGWYNWVAGNNINLNNKFPGVGIWFHYAMSWTVDGKLRVYINGKEMGSKPASSATIHPGGIMALGNSVSGMNKLYNFGGELTKLYIYAKELTAGEIQTLAQSGLCSNAERDLSLTTHAITWRYFLSRKRYGQVAEFIPSSCESYVPSDINCAEELRQKSEQLERIQAELAEETKELNDTKNELKDLREKVEIQGEELRKVRRKLRMCRRRCDRLRCFDHTTYEDSDY